MSPVLEGDVLNGDMEREVCCRGGRSIDRERAGGKGDTSVGRKKLIRRSECAWEGGGQEIERE